MKNIIKHCRGEKKRGIKAIDGIRKKLMIPDYEIYNKVKSKIGTIFANEKVLEQYSVRIQEIDPYFYEHYKKKKYKLMTMIKNTYYLEFIFILLNIPQQQKLMKKVVLTEILFLKKKEKKNQKKNLIANLLELILVEKIMMRTMKLVKYKHLLVNLKKQNKSIRR